MKVTEHAFLSPEPEVAIENIFDRPYDNAVATARTCYSPRGVVSAADVAGDAIEDPVRRARRQAVRDSIAVSTYRAGHHTTLQHAHVQFRLANVSRQFIWSFLHNHPFYNSEQVSQRYVAVKPGGVIVPPLSGEALETYRRTVEEQTEAYERLAEELEPVVAEAYFGTFRARRGNPRYAPEVTKRAREIARYVLPVGTFAYLYHTVSVVTLLRYWRMCAQGDVPLESREVVERMVARLLEKDPQFEKILEDPIPPEESPEDELVSRASGADRRRFAEEFDRELGGRISRLVDWKRRNEEILADAVREVFGLAKAELGDDEAIALALDPARNRLLGSALNLTTHSRLLRALAHPSYTFRKKLSHAADSQDQRHRLTPGSRPAWSAYLGEEPDYVVPRLIRGSGSALRRYEAALRVAWDGIAKLRRQGVPPEFRTYLLPNAVSIRFTQSADLLNLRHKMAMRLCYNAQEEIWQASVEEAAQIREVNPRIGKFLLPPCGSRHRSGESPICPEGVRFCGVPVWRLDLAEYRRVL